MQWATEELRSLGHGQLLDIGCGAARNALPLAKAGWNVLGTDLSLPMLQAARARAATQAGLAERLQFALAPMRALPVADRSVDFIVAHGIWNLAASAEEFRAGVREAARVARPGAALFVFTFSRNTLPEDAHPVSGEPFVFTQFSGQPQVFLSEAELLAELDAHGFAPNPAVPLTEYNRRPAGILRVPGPPVIYECGFRYIK
jgi:ubiquinone/menaquinone biosynthesis C-methylase UbiE